MHILFPSLLIHSICCLNHCCGLASDIQQPIDPEPYEYPIVPSLLDITIEDIWELYDTGSLTSVALVQAYLDRIAEVNDVLRPVGEIHWDVLNVARKLDEERIAGKIRSPLHGIPILIKDNIATGDGLNNTAGSVCMLGLQPPRDAPVVKKLRDAGAVILGKASMVEWAGARSAAPLTNGWSAYGGQVVGAYCENQDPLGSSSGSGVAVSVGLSLGALGTETMGSIIAPSAQNNIVGIKPTLGLTSRELVIPITIRQDTVGPMAKTVSDAAAILSVIAGKDPADNYTDLQPFATPPDYARALDATSLRGARIGVPRNAVIDVVGGDNAYELQAFEAALDVMRAAGATVVDNANFSLFAGELSYDAFRGLIRDDNLAVFHTDFVAGVRDYLAKVSRPLAGAGTTSTSTTSTNTGGERGTARVPGSGPPRDLHDIYACTRADAREEHPRRDARVWDEALARRHGAGSAEVWRAHAADVRMGGSGSVLGALDAHGLDALVLPALSAMLFPALAGLPVVTVPLGAHPAGWGAREGDEEEGGKKEGPKGSVVRDAAGKLVQRGPNTPFGIGFMGRAWSEETLIGLAYAFEQRTMERRKVRPWLKPETELKLGR